LLSFKLKKFGKIIVVISDHEAETSTTETWFGRNALKFLRRRKIGITVFSKTTDDSKPNVDYLAPFEKLGKFSRLLSHLLLRYCYR